MQHKAHVYWAGFMLLPLLTFRFYFINYELLKIFTKGCLPFLWLLEQCFLYFLSRLKNLIWQESKIFKKREFLPFHETYPMHFTQPLINVLCPQSGSRPTQDYTSFSILTLVWPLMVKGRDGRDLIPRSRPSVRSPVLASYIKYVKFHSLRNTGLEKSGK